MATTTQIDGQDLSRRISMPLAQGIQAQAQPMMQAMAQPLNAPQQTQPTVGGAVQLPGGNPPSTGGPSPQRPTPDLSRVSGPGLQPEPHMPDPFASIGGGVYVNGGWVPRGHAAAGGAEPAPGQPAAPADPNAPPATVNDAFRSALMNMLQTNQQAPTLDDPALKGQMDAFRVGQTRAGERAREAMAERRASMGQSSDLAGSGAIDQDLAGLFQAQGEAEAGFGAGLVGQELQQRRQQLMQAAALAGNQLNAEEARSLQERLAQLDAAIRREGIAQQGSLGGRELDIRQMLGSGQLNLGLLGTLLQNEQFGQNLGANLGLANANMNQNALLRMFGL
jgi:hypothetical protein